MTCTEEIHSIPHTRGCAYHQWGEENYMTLDDTSIIALHERLPWTMEMRMLIRDAVAQDPTRRTEYAHAEMYHAPYVFWGLALKDGLITREEHERARATIGELWNYVGD